MTMELTGPGGEQAFSHHAWKLLLDLALRSGWQPAGALEPEQEEPGGPPMALDAADYEVPQESPLAQTLASLMPADDPVVGSYFYNAGFRVTSEDALALADALERALPDVPDHDAMAEKTFYHPKLPGVRLVDARTPVNPYEWFGGQKELLREFVAFCREGGFEIW